MKRKKAAGFDNITNEEITSLLPDDSEEDDLDPQKKVSSLQFIFKILSDFWFNECVPQDLKRTVLRPFLKNQGKSACDPSNYRPISLLNTLMKMYEALICKRLMSYLEKNKILSPFQAAFRRHRSTADHILTLHEIFLEYRYNKTGPRGGRNKKRHFFIFLDLKKAFDSVSRSLLFSKLFKAGVRGKMFRVIKNLFSSNLAQVLIDGFLSPTFVINRGVLQGSKLGPTLFNLFINDLLDSLNNSYLGVTIGDIQTSALGFADDIVLVTDCPIKAQGLLNICQAWAITNNMTFNTSDSSKCGVMVLNGPVGDVVLKLNNEILKIVERYKYLGITLESKRVTNLFKTHFSLMLEKARTRVTTISRLGFRDGLRLRTSIKLYKILLRPILEYCAQVLTL